MSLLTNILFNLLNTRKTDNNNANNILKNAPTAENINIVIEFNYWKLLLFLFPNSFKNDNEACDFYEQFCEKAKISGEKEENYKIPQKVWINYKIDMISGLIISWNSYNKSPAASFIFPVFQIDEIKNKLLKNEVMKLYEENYEHLEQLGISYKLGEKIRSNSSFEMNYSCISRPYCKTSNRYIQWEQCTKNFNLPTKHIIKFLRKIKTNEMLLSDEEILEQIKDIEDKYKEFNCKININKFEAEICNDIFDTVIYTEYNYPATFSFDKFKLPYNDIDLP